MAKELFSKPNCKDYIKIADEMYNYIVAEDSEYIAEDIFEAWDILIQLMDKNLKAKKKIINERPDFISYFSEKEAQEMIKMLREQRHQVKR